MRCVIIAGSPEYSLSLIKKTVKPDDFVICADKGYEYSLAANITPNLIVGDFDSYKNKISADCETIVLDVHKNDTDTMHAITVALERECRDFVILSAIGGRIDHTLANIACLQYIAQNGGRGVLLSETEQIEFLSIGIHDFDGYNGKTFSLFPYGCEQVCVSYCGAKYPLDRYELESSVTRGVSNVFDSEKCVVHIHNGNAIIVINLSDYVL